MGARARHPLWEALRPTRLLLAAMAALGCGNSPAGDARDAGLQSDGEPGPGSPGYVRAPTLTPCPAGWREIDEAGLTWCDPWPESGREECATGSEHFPGDPGCTPIGTTCPDDGWPIGHASIDYAIYIDPASTADAPDGTFDAPFASIADANPTDGSTLVLRAGAHAGHSFAASIAVSLIGACPQSTSAGTLRVEFGGQLIIRNMRVALNLPTGSSADVRDSFLKELLLGGHLVGESVAVVGPLVVAEGGLAELSRVKLSHPVFDAQLAQVSVWEGGEVRLARAVASDLMVNPLDPDPAPVLFVWRGTAIVDESALCHGCLEVREGQATVKRSLIGDSSSDPVPEILLPTVACALTSTAGTLRLERTTVSAGQLCSVRLSAGSATLADLFLRRGLATRVPGTDVPDGELPCPSHYGRGLVAEDGAQVSATRIWLSGVRDAGLFAVGAQTRLDAVDLALLDTADQLCTDASLLADAACTMPSCLWNGPIGLAANAGATVTATDFRIARSAQAGVLVGSDAHVELERGLISGNPLGASVQNPDFDIANLQNQVVWAENDVNLDTVAVDLPPPLPELVCTDGQDNDSDGSIDCDDEDCIPVCGD